MTTFQQHIPHTWTNNVNLQYAELGGGPVIVNTSDCCRGFHDRILVGGVNFNYLFSLREMIYEGSPAAQCGTSAGTKVWSSSAINIRCSASGPFTATHSGSGTYNGGTGVFSGQSTGSVTGSITGAITVDIAGMFTSPTAGSGTATISGALTGTASFTITGGTTGTVTWTITSPAGVIATGSFSFTVTGPSTFTYSGTISGTWNGTTDVVYLWTEVQNCLLGGTTFEVRNVSDDTLVARYRNQNHGYYEGGNRTQLYRDHAVCPNSCIPRILFGSSMAGDYWPDALGLHMHPREATNCWSASNDPPTTVVLTMSSDGVAPGDEIDGATKSFSPTTNCALVATYAPFSPVPAASFTVNIPSSIYEEEATVTLVTGIAPDNFYKVMYHFISGYGPAYGLAHLVFNGQVNVDRVRLSDSVVVTQTFASVSISAAYRGSSPNICDDKVLDWSDEWVTFSVVPRLSPTASPGLSSGMRPTSRLMPLQMNVDATV